MARPGLRLQILLLLGALLVLGFLPLYFAVQEALSVAFLQSRTEATRALGRTLSAYLLEAQAHRSNESMTQLVEAQLQAGGVEAIAIYDAAGERTLLAGFEGAREQLPTRVSLGQDGLQELAFDGKEATLVTVSGASATVSSVLSRAEPRVGILIQLFGWYMVLIGVLLLATSYFTLTRWIVTPIASLSRAAQRVAQTTRRLELPETHSRELHDLSKSMQTMTEKLLFEEQALRNKVIEVEKATDQLKTTQAQLLRSERLASVGQLAAGLAHEVGNPIAAMMGMQDLILGADLSAEEQLDFVARMRKETERIHRILRDLLDFARPGRGGDAPSEPGDVEVAVHETTTLVLPQPIARNLHVEIDVFPDLPLVRLPQEHLTQVLLNLLLNAASACKGGGKVRVSARKETNHVELIVEDDGPGVPESLRDRIFEPFVSSKDVGEGSGLGLSVCRGLVEASGGTITLDAVARKGARFVLELPVVPASTTAESVSPIRSG